MKEYLLIIENISKTFKVDKNKELKRIREDFKTAIILVTHNMGVASYISDKIAVMKNGEIIEFGDKEQIIKNPQKEYTKSLLNAIINLK